METMPCYRPLSHNSLRRLFDLRNTNRTGADVCTYFPVVLRKHTSLFTPSPMVRLHISHRYLIVRVHYVMQKCWKVNKTSSQTTFPFNYRHSDLAHCVYTWFKLDLIILALAYISSVDHKCLSSVCIRCETYCLH